MRRRDTINTNDSFIYFHSFLMTEMADGKGKPRRPADAQETQGEGRGKER